MPEEKAVEVGEAEGYEGQPEESGGQAMMQMKKIDIAAIEAARPG